MNRTRQDLGGNQAPHLVASPTEPRPEVESGHRPYQGQVPPRGQVEEVEGDLGVDPSRAGFKAQPWCRPSPSRWSPCPESNRDQEVLQSSRLAWAHGRGKWMIRQGSNLDCRGQSPEHCRLCYGSMVRAPGADPGGSNVSDSTGHRPNADKMVYRLTRSDVEDTEGFEPSVGR